MTRLIPFFLFLFFYGTTLALAMSGNTSISTATLAAGIDSDDTSITVDSTTGFIGNPLIIIENESIYCSGKNATTFTGCDRGVDNSKASSHLAGKRVYNEATGTINQLIGYNVVKMIADDGLFKGTWNAITVLPGVFVNLFSKLVLWNWPFFEGYASYLKIFMYIISAGLIVSLIQLVLKRG